MRAALAALTLALVAGQAAAQATPDVQRLNGYARQQADAERRVDAQTLRTGNDVRRLEDVRREQEARDLRGASTAVVQNAQAQPTTPTGALREPPPTPAVDPQAEERAELLRKQDQLLAESNARIREIKPSWAR